MKIFCRTVEMKACFSPRPQGNQPPGTHERNIIHSQTNDLQLTLGRVIYGWHHSKPSNTATLPWSKHGQPLGSGFHVARWGGGPFLTEPCRFPTFLLCWSSSMWPHCFRCAPATIEWLVFWLWSAFGWLLLDLQRFCCPVLWILLIFQWNISQFRGMGLKSGRVHMTSQTVTSWRWHLNHGADWRPLFARVPLAWPSIVKSWQMVEVWCQDLNAGTQTLIAWCVSLDCFAEDTMYGLMSLAFCNALICRWLQPLPRTWARSVF